MTDVCIQLGNSIHMCRVDEGPQSSKVEGITTEVREVSERPTAARTSVGTSGSFGRKQMDGDDNTV